MQTTQTLMLPPLKHWINGAWVESPGKKRAVVNPATQETIAEVPLCTPEELDTALDAATHAFQLWSAQPVTERIRILKNWEALIHKNIDSLVILLSAEQGKPHKEARSEIISSASYLGWFAEEARRMYGEIVPPPQTDRRMLVIRQPIGVVGAITPWNFPAGMITRKVAPALAAGCTVILKPATQTPLTALALGELAEKAGLPKGVLNIIIGDATLIGRTFSTDPRVHKISFTGSTAVGKVLLEWASPNFKRLSMELGGNAPFIIFEDADLDAAIDGVMLSRFRNAGQTCVCTNRLYIHRKHYERAVKQITQRASQLCIGAGHLPDTQMGPLIDKQSVDRALSWVEEALQEGAKLHTGGKRHASGPNFMEPTVLTQVTHDMRVVKEESFAPVLPIMVFDHDEEAITQANSTPYGLAAYFYTNHLKRIVKAMEELKFGMVGVNTPHASNESVPFGGVKHSGMGREGSRHGLDDYTELKTVCLSGIV